MLSSNVVTESSKTTATTVQVFSDDGTLLRGEKHEGGGGFGLLVLGMNHPHQERSQKCLRTTSIKAKPQSPRVKRPRLSSGKSEPHRPGRVPKRSDR